MPDKPTRREKANPQITSAEVGTRNLRKVTIYPLSMGDQLKLTDMISEAMQAFFSLQEEGKEDINPEFIAFAVSLLKANIDNIIKMVTDEEPEKLKDDLTNDQLSNIIGIIYNANFADPLKKVQSLFQRDEILGQVTDEQILSSLEPQSAKSTDTGSQTSTKNRLKKVD